MAGARADLQCLAWGISWWPFRWLEQRGLHPLLTTAIVYVVAGAVIVTWRPRAVGQLLRLPSLWVIAFAAGTTLAMFNWGVVVGDVVRVVLLFYLMPLWTVVLARVLLNEPITARAGARVLLAVGGAVVVLWPAGRGWEALPLPRSLADWLGIAGGIAFALNNVASKRAAHHPEQARVLAMFVGGALVSSGLATVLTLAGRIPNAEALSALNAGLVPVLLVLVGLFLASTLALQYGVARLSANVSSVVMLTEVLFAAGSALALGAGSLTLQLAIGGLLIVGAALLSALGPDAAG